MISNLHSFLYLDEEKSIQHLLENLEWNEDLSKTIYEKAFSIVENARTKRRKTGNIESFFQQYQLNTKEGLALMCLAEALLRIPDIHTGNKLIKDKIASTRWGSTGVKSDDWLVRASGLGLQISEKTINSIFAKIGEPFIYQAMMQAMQILGHQFVLGETIDSAVKKAKPFEKKGYRFSYDMLGEAARTEEDAQRYFDQYKQTLDTIAAVSGTLENRPGISVKLSALHPRYEFSQEDRCIPVLVERLKALCEVASAHDLALTVDAEEVNRLETSLKIITQIFEDQKFRHWQGFGLAVQTYQKRALPLLDYIIDQTRKVGKKIQVRLVKGAYWDTEIKEAQVMGEPDFPVFTRKANTDLCYLTCAKKMMENRDVLYPMFGTHNAHSMAAILEFAGEQKSDFEFQRLHGMGENLYAAILEETEIPVSVYAPVGDHRDLLPYLVRRLLENGANSSFVNQIEDKTIPVEDILADPVEKVKSYAQKNHPAIKMPMDLFQPERKNSKGMNIHFEKEAENLQQKVEDFLNKNHFEASPFIKGKKYNKGSAVITSCPANRSIESGKVYFANQDHIEEAFKVAKDGFQIWSNTPSEKRAQALEKYADLMEEHMEELIAICAHEAGKTLEDGIAEVREAVDFCRYYAARGRRIFDERGQKLPGPTGEDNILYHEARGVFVCISPWNFPLAIFTGQIVAALMAGNAVIAKPAEQASLIGMKAVELMIKAGVPREVLTLLPGDGNIGAALVQHKDVSGVAFTGSTEAARHINRALAEKDGPITPLIAETGGLNAMIVDSSALTEQVVDDVITSAFGSAGQRCSACRVLYIQDDVFERTVQMLKGAMAEIRLGDPKDMRTDIGPVIDEEALSTLIRHRKNMQGCGKLLAEVPLDKTLKNSGNFFAPCVFEILDIKMLEREVFGPFLHVIKYKAKDLNKIIDEINNTRYGLTFGLHSRIDNKMRQVSSRVRAGNLYVNRSTIGAIVGSQPFGGRGLSGTGPKAGGPHYLYAFATEKSLCVDTTASGGNASLATLDE